MVDGEEKDAISANRARISSGVGIYANTWVCLEIFSPKRVEQIGKNNDSDKEKKKKKNEEEVHMIDCCTSVLL